MAVIYHLSSASPLIQYISIYVIFLNLLLAFFNLIPVPPLDGSKVLGVCFSAMKPIGSGRHKSAKGYLSLCDHYRLNLIGSKLVGRIVCLRYVPLWVAASHSNKKNIHHGAKHGLTKTTSNSNEQEVKAID
jgi:membrane-associated protease RseP (regulator of RpoE activity)